MEVVSHGKGRTGETRKLLLVRHSQPEIDPAVSASLWRLSVEGRRRCRGLAVGLSVFDPTVIVTSSETKAIETGQIVARELNVPLETAADLHEHDRRGAPFLKGKGEFEAQVIHLFEKPGELVFGNESADEAHRRFATAVDRVLQSHRQGNLAVVSHGTVMTLFVARAAEVDPVSFWRALNLPAVVVMEVPGLDLLDVIEFAV